MDIIEKISKLDLNIDSNTALQIAEQWIQFQYFKIGCLTLIIIGVVAVVAIGIGKSQ